MNDNESLRTFYALVPLSPPKFCGKWRARFREGFNWGILSCFMDKGCFKWKMKKFQMKIEAFASYQY